MNPGANNHKYQEYQSQSQSMCNYQWCGGNRVLGHYVITSCVPVYPETGLVS